MIDQVIHLFLDGVDVDSFALGHVLRIRTEAVYIGKAMDASNLITILETRSSRAV